MNFNTVPEYINDACRTIVYTTKDFFVIYLIFNFQLF